MKKTVNVVVGTPVYRQGAYIIDKFLSNQREIHENYPSSELVLATNEDDFGEELQQLLILWELKGEVILYETVKPDYARGKTWNTACAREAIRQYTLLQTEARYLLFLDADMTCDPSVIGIMENKIQGYDVVYSGCPRRDFGIELTGPGSSMLSRRVLEKIRFRCLEFKNGEVIDEGGMLEVDTFRLGSRIKKGFFLTLSHYKSESEARYISPQPVGLLRRIANSPLIRYGLIRASIAAKHNIPEKLKVLLNKLLATTKSF